MNLAGLLQRSANTFGERPALQVGTNLWCDYRTLHERVARMAGWLRRELGFDRGDRIALVLRNCPEYVELLFACWHAGLIAVPINAKLHPREIHYILSQSGARACFTNPELESNVSEAVVGLHDPIEVIESTGLQYQQAVRSESVPMEDVEDDVAWLFYTSGTTGQPKGAMLTHENLLSMTRCYFADVDHIEPSDCILHAAPMSHGSGLYIIPHVLVGAANVIPESGGFDNAEVIELFTQHHGITFFAAPTMVRRLSQDPAAVDSDHVGLKTIVYGGGPMYLADLDQAHKIFGHRLVQIYGQGESPMTITALSNWHHRDIHHPRHRQRLASAGTAQSEILLCVTDSDDCPLPAGEVGEVLVKGNSVMRGYWCDSQNTADTLRNNWLHTGDLGSLDKDGFLTLTDRARDLIISGGANIYPREVEEVLLRHPSILEASVVGVPDREWGERVVAFVVAPDHEPTVTELDSVCLEHMARFKRPREYFFVNELPKNNYGKVLKTELRLQLKEHGTQSQTATD
jgi:long-chain acyl-CoA synthetase